MAWRFRLPQATLPLKRKGLIRQVGYCFPNLYTGHRSGSVIFGSCTDWPDVGYGDPIDELNAKRLPLCGSDDMPQREGEEN